MPRISVCVAGATGLVGQTLLARLSRHPWFQVCDLLASNHHHCQTYREAVKGHFAIPEAQIYADLKLKALDAPVDCPVVFSCLPSGIARTWESLWARQGHFVITNASDLRSDPNVPLLIPEINAHHIERLKNTPTQGRIVANPNCGVAGFALVAGALTRYALLEHATVTTFQSISGAGLKGLSAWSALDNLIPFIPGEEEKWHSEPQKILGDITPEGFQPYPLTVEATCVRVPVRRGHLLSVTLSGSRELDPQSVQNILNEFRPDPDIAELPSCPKKPLHVLSHPLHPQPLIDLDPEGMTVTVGRIRGQSGRVQFLALVDNLIRGAAGNAILSAELAISKGLI